MITFNQLVSETTRRATAKNPRAKQKEVSNPQAANLVATFFAVLAEQPADVAMTILAERLRKATVRKAKR